MNDITALLPLIRLRFNIEHPSFEECYAFGYECALAELNEGENPFSPGTKESEQWFEGWWDGFYGEKPLYEGVVDLTAQPKTTEPVAAANDHTYYGIKTRLYSKMMEFSGMFAVSAAVGYQVLDLVA